MKKDGVITDLKKKLQNRFGNFGRKTDVKTFISHIVLIAGFVHFSYGQSVPGKSFYNPTGSYKLAGKVKIKDGETYGYHGEIYIKLLDSAHIAISFYVSKGAPGYNSGSFLDTLDYGNNIAIYKTEDDSTCTITFKFSNKGVIVDEIAANYNNGCGFGHAVVASGYYKKLSSRTPEIKDPFVE